MHSVPLGHPEPAGSSGEAWLAGGRAQHWQVGTDAHQREGAAVIYRTLTHAWWHHAGLVVKVSQQGGCVSLRWSEACRGRPYPHGGRGRAVPQGRAGAQSGAHLGLQEPGSNQAPLASLLPQAPANSCSPLPTFCISLYRVGVRGSVPGCLRTLPACCSCPCPHPTPCRLFLGLSLSACYVSLSSESAQGFRSSQSLK